MAKYDPYEDNAGRWRWRLVADNGRIVAASGESFASRANALRAAADAKRISANATAPVLVRRARKPASLADALSGRSEVWVPRPGGRRATF